MPTFNTVMRNDGLNMNMNMNMSIVITSGHIGYSLTSVKRMHLCTYAQILKLPNNWLMLATLVMVDKEFHEGDIFDMFVC